jgi:hypothetical protein
MRRPDKRAFVVPPILRQKTKLSIADWLFGVWFYLTIQVSAVVSMVVVCLIAAATLPDGPAIAFGTIYVICACAVLIWAIAGWDNEPLSWNYKKRRSNVLMNRNRVRAPHAPERAKRVWELRHEYKQYSVWPSWDVDDVVLKLVAHSWYRRPLGLGGYWKYAMPVDLGYTERNNIWGGGYSKAIAKITDPKPEEVQKMIDETEAYAAAMEQNSYEAAVKRFEAQRLALELRRPPSKRVAVSEVEDEEIPDN